MLPNGTTHIIHRNLLELDLPPDGLEQSVPEQVKNLFYSSMGKVEEVLSLYDLDTRVTQIDKVVLDLGNFRIKDLDDQFTLRLCEALRGAFEKAGLLPVKDLRGDQYDSAYNLEDAITGTQDPLNSLDSLSKLENIQQLLPQKKIEAAFLYFLRNGSYPWWISDKMKNRVEQTFSISLESPDDIFISKVRELLNGDHNAFARLMLQFPASFTQRLVRLLYETCDQQILRLYKAARQYWRSIYNTIEHDVFSSTALFVRLLVANSVEEAIAKGTEHIRYTARAQKISLDRFLSALSYPEFQPYSTELRRQLLQGEKSIKPGDERIISSRGSYSEKARSKDFPPETKDCKEEINTSPELEDKFAYVGHAGLVLLHPYLPSLFSELGIIDEQEQFIDLNRQMDAVFLLHFLATGNTTANEHDLPFCKFLCGMDLRFPLRRYTVLEKHEVEECEKLLRACISHWQVLKGTSPDGLREGFLMRNGKLDFTEETATLFVESKAQDVLLERLPWAISYISLPWKSEPFATIWN